jgi:ubiquinone/menaquinone biosynthesis C-methylase UbiE
VEKREDRKLERVRKPFQGTWNIIRFNRHFYIIGILFLILTISLLSILPVSVHIYLLCIVLLATIPVIISLVVSAWVYDFSNLYWLNWLPANLQISNGAIVNINAGFDETSVLLHKKYPGASLKVFDFYDPEKNTEISIKRARKAYPAYPGTVSVKISSLGLADNSADVVFVILSAHEIRDKDERKVFFKEINRVLKPGGRVIVVEHLRDFANFLAYTIGFFHFFSKKSWLDTFESSGFSVEKEIKITPFISSFILSEHGSIS